MPTPPKKIQADPPRPKPNSTYDYNEVQPESRQVSDPLHANDETFRIKNVEKIDNFRIFFSIEKQKK